VKIRVPREALLEACKLADRVAPPRSVHPAVGQLLADAREGGCTLQATDLEVSLRLEVGAVVEEPGQALLPVRQALAILREAGADEVAIESFPGRVWLRGQGAEFELEAGDPGRFPLVGPFPEGPCSLLPSGPLALALHRTAFAAGRESSRYSLQGLLWEAEPGQVRLVATDNRRLAVAEVPALTQDSPPLPGPCLVPVKTADLLEKVAAGREEAVRVLFGPEQALFQAGGATLCARYVEGPYPPWRRVLPTGARHRLPVPVGPFLSGVKQAAVLREREDARLLLRFEPGRVTLQSRQAGTGHSRVEQALPFAGAPLDITLNPRYLVELLRAFDPESTLQLELTDADTVALFRSGDGVTHVLMPLRPG
jgi:DNA polymerase-3 subunit beta